MKDVARTAGVSTGTVPHALDRPELVSPPTRAAVMPVVESLGHVRLAGARQPRGNASSRLLALYGVDVTDPLDAALTAAVGRAAEEAGPGVPMCGGGHGQGRMRRDVTRLAAHQVRGVVIAARSDAKQAPAACVERGVACVVAGQDLTAVGACSVTVDDRTGGRAAATHPLARGHRSVVVVAGPGPMTRRGRRGGTDALEEAGDGAFCAGESATEGISVGAGRDAGQRLLGVTPRPAAALCFQDLPALGLMRALHGAGVRVPHGVAVVGYEDPAFAPAAVVPLTSVRRPARSPGTRAGRLLVERTAQAAHEHVHGAPAPELVVRRSALSGPLQPPALVTATRFRASLREREGEWSGGARRPGRRW
ncbi:LacI family DNA-binding transcriptional regulator [Streptomyces sp. NPDC014656]|uniref:LacI family DNA-binding transcriptional regulator n=1 Tax=Streptomyces sp. NPDC014656 TaxID=3364878 RepID=UPI0036FEBB93